MPEADGERYGVEGVRRDDALAVLVLGESTAAGVGVRTQANGLAPAIAAGLARHAGRPVSWRGCSSNRDYRAAGADQLGAVTAGRILRRCRCCSGVNDVLGMRSARAWQHDVAALVAGLQPHLRPGGGIVLAGLPDLAGFPSLPQPMRSVLALHARHLDRRLARAAASAPSTVHASSPPIDSRGLYAEGGFHPSAEGYRRWATHLVDAATVLSGSRG